LPRRRGVGGQSFRIGRVHHVDLEAARAQHARADETVSSVVAGPGEHYDAPRPCGEQRCRKIRRGNPCTFHEPLVRMQTLEAAQGGYGKDGCAAQVFATLH